MKLEKLFVKFVKFENIEKNDVSKFKAQPESDNGTLSDNDSIEYDMGKHYTTN